ncbi:hypothetical protein F895_00172 [Acinetobacter sp. CIP 64.2]|uniref:DUF805 domain-containing protein n=1 Tax=Acinetobacter TaxID=469 RepID=UPI000289A07E|nr:MULTISPECIES: DUF805 domain-containing protein [Acinetobacter]ENX18104.1 hypothetical protein F895_00172 [Acinetobacter sp. CIP 64.2]UUM28355.1 DUF805 domain-containing protein [Acinetobacter colistiniresistens]
MFNPESPAPTLISTDQPLSPNGRFNRLSYIGWYGLLSLICMAAFLGIFAFAGIFTTSNIDEAVFSAFSGITFFAFIALWLITLYFQIVFLIRRLHDLNKTGWLSLLLLVPVLQFLFTLYVLFAPGTPHRNDYGDVRPSRAWEKLLAWIMILVSLLMMFGIFTFAYYFASPDLWDAPTQILQNTTGYF